jgi:hypothetical protein
MIVTMLGGRSHELEVFAGPGDAVTLKSGGVYRSMAAGKTPALLQTPPAAASGEQK